MRDSGKGCIPSKQSAGSLAIASDFIEKSGPYRLWEARFRNKLSTPVD
jgi:hypothetical protein